MEEIINNSDVTLLIDESHAQITLHSRKQRNSLSKSLLSGFHDSLTAIEESKSVRLVSIRSSHDDFCVGMDFEEYLSGGESIDNDVPAHYMRLLKRIASLDKLVVSCIDGQVLAGGVGIVAASDIAIATNRSTFSLPEILWGLVPSCVLPFLIRRVGFQIASRLTLTGETIDAADAFRYQLIDIVTDDHVSEMRKLKVKAQRVHPIAVANAKTYMDQLFRRSETYEVLAVDHVRDLLKSERVKKNISGFVENNILPWQHDN